MKMNETIKSMLDHPFATTWIIGSITSGVVSIIRAARGNVATSNAVVAIDELTKLKEE